MTHISYVMMTSRGIKNSQRQLEKLCGLCQQANVLNKTEDLDVLRSAGPETPHNLTILGAGGPSAHVRSLRMPAYRPPPACKMTCDMVMLLPRTRSQRAAPFGYLVREQKQKDCLNLKSRFCVHPNRADEQKHADDSTKSMRRTCL